MLDVSMVERLVETCTLQIEKLAYTKNRDSAIRLEAAVEMAIRIGEIRTDRWKTRVDAALARVMMAQPEADLFPVDVSSALQPVAKPVAF